MQELVRAQKNVERFLQKKSRRTKQNRCVNAKLPELTIVSVPGSSFLFYNPYGDVPFLSIVYARSGNRYSKECKQLDRMRLLYERIIWTAITGTAFETSFDVGASSRKSRPFCQLYRDGGARTKGTGACNHCQNACWGHPKPFHSAPFRCRLRIPAERFLSGDALRVIEDLHQMGCRFI